MSTDHTGSDQLNRMRTAGLRVQQLQPLLDVDTPQDADTVAQAAPDTAFAAAWSVAIGAGR